MNRMCWSILLVCFLIQVLCSIAALSWGPLSPYLIKSFHVNHAQLGLFTTLVYLATLLFSLPGGWLVDKIGIRLLLSICPGLMGLCYIFFSQSVTLLQAYVAVFFMGLAYVFINPTTVKALSQWFPDNMRGTAISIKQSGVTLGGAVAAVLLPIMSSAWGWRTSAAWIGIGVFIGTVISYFFYRDPQNATGSARSQPIRLDQILEVIKNRNLLFLSATILVFFSIQLIIVAHFVIYLVEARLLTVVKAGTYLLVVNVAGAMGRVSWGVLSDRVFNGRRKPVLMMIGLTNALVMLIVGLFGTRLGEGVLYVIVFLLGFTSHGWNGVFFAAASEMAGDRMMASGVGWATTIVCIAVIVGPPLFGWIVDVTLSYTIAWVAFAIVSGASVLFLIPIRDGRKQALAL